MKYLNKFESFDDGFDEIEENKPEIGDYVICKEHGYDSDPVGAFLESNVGRYIYYSTDGYFKYCVEYENVPSSLTKEFNKDIPEISTTKRVRYFILSEIKHWAKNKEELEALIASKKYNL